LTQTIQKARITSQYSAYIDTLNSQNSGSNLKTHQNALFKSSNTKSRVAANVVSLGASFKDNKDGKTVKQSPTVLNMQITDNNKALRSAFDSNPAKSAYGKKKQ